MLSARSRLMTLSKSEIEAIVMRAACATNQEGEDELWKWGLKGGADLSEDDSALRLVDVPVGRVVNGSDGFGKGRYVR